MFKVKKRDGSIENFDRRKIVVGALKAGGTNTEAEKLAAMVEAWLPTVAISGIVKSQDIRAKNLELLKSVNPTVGGSFEYYRKPA